MQQPPARRYSMDRFASELDFTDTRPVLFDVGWEVAKKVGGIYTVLKSKSPITVEEFGGRYALVGPYNQATAATEMEEMEPGPLFGPVIARLRERYGIIVHFGKWLVDGYPKVLLIDVNSSMHELDKWRGELMGGWDVPGDFECNDGIVFGYQTALLIREFTQIYRDIRLIAHFHEWQAAVGLIVARIWNVKFASIFTTHATLLGRFLASGGVDLYNQIAQINVDSEASRRGIYHRHWIEQRAALECHVFTTVSEITAYEAERILRRRADVIVPNGLQVKKFTALHEFQNLHAKYKEVIHEFVLGHFYGHYNFDLDNTVYFFTSGRHEYFNKGVDMFIDALAGLNYLLKQRGSNITVVAFIIMPAPTNNFNVESLKGQSLIRDLKRTTTHVVEKLSDRIFEATARGQMPDVNDLLKEEEIVMLKRRIYTVKQRNIYPPIVTHNMINEGKDEILNHLRRVKLWNDPADLVKVIYHPEFLSSTSPLIPLDYPDFVRACHLGIFPSYYEPWGYTPAECTVLGVPSITTNLSGFGNYVHTNIEDHDSKGLFIVDRRFKAPNETVDQIIDILWKFCQLDRRHRIELRNRCEQMSQMLDWKNLGKAYQEARHLALERVYGPVDQPDIGALKISS
jgi:glycogen(starch) synthase